MGRKKIKTDNIAFKSLLNKNGFHSVAAVSLDIDYEEWRYDDKIQNTINGTLCISDCSRVVSLDLTCYKKTEKRNVLGKLKALKTAIEKAEEFINKKELTE